MTESTYARHRDANRAARKLLAEGKAPGTAFDIDRDADGRFHLSWLDNEGNRIGDAPDRSNAHTTRVVSAGEVENSPPVPEVQPAAPHGSGDAAQTEEAQMSTSTTKTKKSRTPKAKAAKTNGSNGHDKSKTDECIRLAQRKNGVTPDELREATGWTKAPWKWLFHNPKKTGWLQKRDELKGFKFRSERVEGQVRYFIEA